MYTEIGIRSFGKGIFHKTPVLGASLGNKRVLQIQPGDIVFNNVFAWEGAVAVAGEAEAGKIGSHRFVTYTTIGNQCSVEYLRLFFCSQPGLEVLRRVSPGSAGRNRTLNIAQFAKQEIPLPSLKEQLRIVARVEELTGKIEEARSLRQQALEAAEAILGAAVERIVKNLNQKYESQNLIDLVDSDRGISYGVVLTGEPHESGVPTLRAGDLQKFRVLLKNVKCIAPEIEAKYRRTRLCGNELLLRIRGGLGELAVCPPEMIGGNVSREIAVIPFTNNVLPHYGMYVLSAPSNQTAMTEKLRGSSYVGINLRDVRRLLIPVPPLSEQRRIITYLNNFQAKVDEMKRLREQAIRELDALVPSILDKAFKGEL
jgi:type I restriction enzyme S subunit